jgi:large subunit ribosomal protein L22
MGKQASPRKVGDKEALAVGTTIRGSAQKLNLVAQMIRGRKVEEALNILKFSPKGWPRMSQGARVGGRQCGEQPQSRRRRAGRRRGERRQVALDEAVHDPRPRPLGRIVKPFSRLRVVVREQEEA